MPPWARASELDRAIMCPGSTHLARVTDSSGEAAKWGTIVHSWKETGEWPDNSLMYRRRTQAIASSGLSRESLWPSTSGTHEVAYALNTQSRICDKYSGPREGADAWKASFDDNWITGTADWVGDLLGDAWIDDLKTGREIPSDPWDLWQLRFYALCAVMLTGADTARVSLTHWTRYPADAAPRRVWAPAVTREELLGTTLPLLETARQAAHLSKRSGVADVTPGSHCTWCRAKPNCPAF